MPIKNGIYLRKISSIIYLCIYKKIVDKLFKPLKTNISFTIYIIINFTLIYRLLSNKKYFD